jgi:hypothetical protein
LLRSGNYPERKLDGDVRRRHSGKEMEAEEMLGKLADGTLSNIFIHVMLTNPTPHLA